MRRALLALGLLACQREEPSRVAEEYLTFIEQGKYKRAYELIDNISRKHVSFEDFKRYWEEKAKTWGKPYKHEVLEVSKEGEYIVVDYWWYFQPPEDTSLYQRVREFRLKLRREFKGWRVKFLKYTLKKRKR